MLLVEQKQKIQGLLANESGVLKSIAELQNLGARVYLVGGCVRDVILGIMPDDIDVEVHNVTIEQLASVLSKQGHVIEAGKSFGVLQVAHSAVEWALPRTDSAGRKPQVIVNPILDIKQALSRRDITINAMAIDVATYELIDPFGGRADLSNRILRSPCLEKFTEDPLRFFRVMQFIGRFSATVDPELERVCITMSLEGVARERIEIEFEKLLLKSREPSRGIRWLAKIKRINEILPELAATQGIMQSPEWHPEGDVFEHAMQALDAAAVRLYDNKQEKLCMTYAALCHDLGKVTTTTTDPDGRIRSNGHDLAGVEYTRAFLKRITEEKELIKKVLKLVRYHMMPGALVKQNASAAAYKRLAIKLLPITMRELALLAYADRRGRNGAARKPLTGSVPDIDIFVEKSQKYGVYESPEKPVILGRDLLGMYPEGPVIGELVNFAYDVQINKGIIDKDRLLKLIAHEYKKR